MVEQSTEKIKQWKKESYYLVPLEVRDRNL